MKTLRKSQDRGFADHGWLKSAHTFSFAGYYDDRFMGFRTLRVINEDRVAGGGGFPSHPHRDMEIITYIISGALKHKDSMGNEAVIYPGEVQRMSAGTGVVHSEFNASGSEEAHFLQIWIQTEKTGLEPGYGQKSFADEIRKNKLTLVVSKEQDKGSVGINQDMKLYVGRLSESETVDLPVSRDRHAWVQVIKGEIEVSGEKLSAGDGLAISTESSLAARASSQAEFLFFDLN